MNALFLLDNLGTGGAQRSLQEMLPYFEAGGVNVHVACFQHRDVGIEHLVTARDRLHHLEGESRLAQMRALRKLLGEESIDLLHTSLFVADVFGRAATVGTGIPVVTSLVNMAYEPARHRHDRHVNRLKLGVARGLEAATGHLFCDQFHAITEAVKEAAVRTYRLPRSRITVVHRGRDPERLGRRTLERRVRAREGLGLDDDAFVVLNAARQEFQKGQHHLVEAFAELARERPEAHLLIAGREGNASSVLRDAIAVSGVADRIHLLGHREDLPELLCAADVFAFPSLWEGFGSVLVEVLALELPIVASDLAPIREVCDGGSCGLLVPPEDPRALASALERIADDDGFARSLASAGRKRFESAFTIERSAAGMMEIFERARAAR